MCIRDSGHSWVVTLLPHIDQTNIADRWTPEAPWFAPENASLGSLPLSSVACPSDETSANGGLSYVINSGYADMSVLSEYNSAVSAGNFPSEASMHSHSMLQFDWDESGNISPTTTASRVTPVCRGYMWVPTTSVSGSATFTMVLRTRFSFLRTLTPDLV